MDTNQKATLNQKDSLNQEDTLTCSYRTVYQEGIGEILEKKSRFIASVYPVKTVAEVEDRINALKKQYWDARHNCYAYIVGTDGSAIRCSDDGEPSGTAGKPMLEVLQKEELKDVLVVVTRYFGGVLLGTGGLVRAYTQATKAGIEAAGICTMVHMDILEIHADYNGVGKIKYCLSNSEAIIQQEEYTDVVLMRVAIPREDTKRICKELTEVTSGKASMEVVDEQYLAKLD